MAQQQDSPINHETGQVLVLLLVVMVAILGFASLVFDAGSIYNKRRSAQNAADNAALAGANAICTSLNSNAAALDMANRNGFNNDGTSNTVVVNVPPTQGAYVGDADYIEVIIFSTSAGTLSGSVFGGSMDVTTRAVAHCIQGSGGGGYALFAISESCSPGIELEGSERVLIGGIHTNSTLKISGSTTKITGMVTTVDGLLKDGSITYDPLVNNPSTVGVQPDPVVYNIADYAPGGRFAPGGSDAVANYYDYSGINTSKILNGTIPDGLYYTDGDFTLNKSTNASNITVVAEGQIDFNGSEFEFSEPYVNGLLFFSNYSDSKCNKYGVIHSGSSFIWNGVICVPNSGVKFSGSENEVSRGSIIAQHISVDGSYFKLQYDEDYLPPASDDTIDLAE